MVPTSDFVGSRLPGVQDAPGSRVGSGKPPPPHRSVSRPIALGTGDIARLSKLARAPREGQQSLDSLRDGR